MADQKPTADEKPPCEDTLEVSKPDDMEAEAMADEAIRRVEAVADELRHQADDMPSSPVMNEMGPPTAGLDDRGMDLSMLHDVDLHVTIELGRTRMVVEDVVRLNADSVIELDKAAGDPVDVYVNGRHVARGEVLVVNDNFCIRVSEILPLDRVGNRADEPSLAAGHGGLEGVS